MRGPTHKTRPCKIGGSSFYYITSFLYKSPIFFGQAVEKKIHTIAQIFPLVLEKCFSEFFFEKNETILCCVTF